MPYDPESFILVTVKLPIPYYLVLIQDIDGRKVRGWWTGNEWDFSSKKITPHSWKKLSNQIFFKNEYKKA
jgi:hypothetical protein